MKPGSAPDAVHRRVLMICYLFPPLGGMAVPAVQRVVKFLRGMAGSHWDPVILTLRVDLYEPYLKLEEKYLREIPPAVEVVRTGRVMLLKTIIRGIQRLRGREQPPLPGTEGAPPPAQPQSPATAAAPAVTSKGAVQRFKDALTGAVQTPDPFTGWLPAAFREGRRTIRQRGIECIYATGSPWTSLLVGALLKKSTGLPLVLDFRDPWTTNPYRMHFHPVRRWIEGRLETFVVNSADAVIANTRGLRDEFRARYPRLPAERFEAIYNCVENERALPRLAVQAGSAGPFRLAHAGFLYGPRDPLLLLRAMAKRRQRDASGAPDLLLDLIGPIDVSYPIAKKLSELGLTGVVRIHGPVPHAMCQDMLVASSALLLLQPGTMTQLPSKLFEYVGHGKPMLTLAMPGSETYTFADEQLGSPVADCDDEEAIVRALDELVAQLRAGKGPDVDRWEAAMAQFRPHTITGKLLDTFDRVTTNVARRSDAMGGARA